jgi:hypothetical protein
VTTQEASIKHFGRRILPATRSFLLRWPGEHGGLVWNRPIGVRVEDESGERWIPITDPTRRIQIGLLAAGLTAAFLVHRARRKPRRNLFRRAVSRLRR